LNKDEGNLQEQYRPDDLAGAQLGAAEAGGQNQGGIQAVAAEQPLAVKTSPKVSPRVSPRTSNAAPNLAT